MGSITSRPQIPAQQQAQAPVIITMPQPVYNYAPPASSYIPPAATDIPAGNDNGGGTDTPPVGDEAKAAARSTGLLDRRRGVLGTVLTGFRGLLNQGVTSARKTLLGE